jgi:hypothetical protein
MAGAASVAAAAAPAPVTPAFLKKARRSIEIPPMLKNGGRALFSPWPAAVPDINTRAISLVQ